MSRLIDYNRTIFQATEMHSSYYPLSVERQIEKQKQNRYQNLILLKKTYQVRRQREDDTQAVLHICNLIPQQKALYFTEAPKYHATQPRKVEQHHSYSMLRKESIVNRQRHKQKIQDSTNVFTRDDSKRSIREDEEYQHNFYPHQTPVIHRTFLNIQRQQERSPLRQSQKLNSSRHDVSYSPHQRTHLLIQQINLNNKEQRSIHLRPRRPHRDSVDYTSHLTYYIGPGNNDQVVRDTMALRTQWKLKEQPKHANFTWSQGTLGFQFNRLAEGRQPRVMFNHFEFHKELSLKDSLIKSLSRHCEKTSKYLFDLTPITFVVDIKAQTGDVQFRSFLNYYLTNHPKQNDDATMNRLKTQVFWLKKQLHQTTNITFKQQPQVEKDRYSRPRKLAPDSTYLHPHSKYIWILKPTFLNRGRGIHLFSNLDELRDLLFIKEDYESAQKSQGELPQETSRLTYYQFVIQKYIERPFLFRGRKFDIRVWVLITHKLELYYFKEGYIRTSSEQYHLDNLQNQFVHLTNNAIQQHSTNYGLHESGNQLSFAQLKEFLIQVYGTSFDFDDRIISKIRELIVTTFESVKTRLNVNNRQHSFEIFGYDFIVDEDLMIYLIEVNTNPCIECSSDLLERLIPRMLNDAFKLTLDQVFPNPEVDNSPSLWIHLAD